jgi:hypothetical protein
MPTNRDTQPGKLCDINVGTFIYSDILHPV